MASDYIVETSSSYVTLLCCLNFTILAKQKYSGDNRLRSYTDHIIVLLRGIKSVLKLCMSLQDMSGGDNEGLKIF